MNIGERYPLMYDVFYMVVGSEECDRPDAVIKTWGRWKRKQIVGAGQAKNIGLFYWVLCECTVCGANEYLSEMHLIEDKIAAEKGEVQSNWCECHEYKDNRKNPHVPFMLSVFKEQGD